MRLVEIAELERVFGKVDPSNGASGPNGASQGSDALPLQRHSAQLGEKVAALHRLFDFGTPDREGEGGSIMRPTVFSDGQRTSISPLDNNHKDK